MQYYYWKNTINLLFLSYIGEYAERIDNADELLESFLDNFNDENSQVSVRQDIKVWLGHEIEALIFWEKVKILFGFENYW